MYIKKLTLKNFRCFTDRQFDLDGQFVFVQGNNGIGKTTILEALHYGSNLRSFRTMQQNDLITFGERYFFLSIDVESHDLERTTINVGYSAEEGRQVKLNAQPIQTHKELAQQIRVITLTAEDIQLVSGYPEKRRSFMQHSLMLDDQAHVQLTKKFQVILDQRNSKLFTLKKQGYQGELARRSLGVGWDELLIWTEALWRETITIQEKSIKALAFLEKQVNSFLTSYFQKSEQGLKIALNYNAKQVSTDEQWETFKVRYEKELVFAELATGRSGFGVHLDDFTITFQQQKARGFASRGQQKLIVFLLKIAQMQQIINQGLKAILLLDDFLTDFDANRIHECFTLLASMPFQVIITNPGVLELRNVQLPSNMKPCVVTL